MRHSVSGLSRFVSQSAQSLLSWGRILAWRYWACPCQGCRLLGRRNRTPAKWWTRFTNHR